MASTAGPSPPFDGADRRRFFVLLLMALSLLLGANLCWETGDQLRKWTDPADVSSTRKPQSMTQAPDAPLLELSRRFRPPPSNETAAACLRTIYNGKNRNIMEWTLRWVAYNRLLGFDEILVWYVKHFTPPGFELLKTLPYVTLVENTRNQYSPETMANHKHNPPGQAEDIADCLNRTKNRFDWVFLADADEYLWFAEKVHLKDFLLKHKDKNYLSFGKWFYDPGLHYAGAKNDLFGLEKRPYTYKNYCYGDGKKKQCPSSRGRSKVLFRRNSFDHMGTHGLGPYIRPDRPCLTDRCHFNTDVAHIKEWRYSLGITFLGNLSPEMRDNESIIEGFTWMGSMNETMSNETRLIGNFPGSDFFEMNEEGKNIVYRDDKLQDWLDFLASEQKS